MKLRNSNGVILSQLWFHEEFAKSKIVLNHHLEESQFIKPLRCALGKRTSQIISLGFRSCKHPVAL